MIELTMSEEVHNQGTIMYDYGTGRTNEGRLPSPELWVWSEFREILFRADGGLKLRNAGQEGVSAWIRMFKELKQRIKETEGAHVFWSACDRDPRRVELYDRMVRKMESAIGKKIHRMPIVDNDGLESILYFVTEERL